MKSQAEWCIRGDPSAGVGGGGLSGAYVVIPALGWVEGAEAGGSPGPSEHAA